MLRIRRNKHRTALRNHTPHTVNGDFAHTIENMIYLCLSVSVCTEVAGGWWTGCYSSGEVC